MTYGVNGEGPTESSSAYADLDKLRRELERSTQRARNAEQERDDLARRLDLAGGPDAALRERHEGHPDHSGRAESVAASARGQQGGHASVTGLGFKRPRPSDAELLRGGYDQRSGAAGAPGVSVNVAHGDGPGASITVTTEGHSGAPVSLVSRPHHGGEQMSPPMPYGHLGAEGGARHRASHHDAQYSRMHPDADYSYPEERAERYSMAPHQSSSVHRPSLARFAGAVGGSSAGARSPPTSSSYLTTSSSERSSLPTLSNYPSTSTASSYSATPYTTHPVSTAYEHEMDDLERSRKIARFPLDHHPRSSFGAPPSNNYLITPSASEANPYPIRKLAATKNRTCSNCAAPHDAKFRRGPNGPGTLCDRCGSRWKKFKEQEANIKEGASSATAAARARLSSTSSSSSQSPMDPSPLSQGQEGARVGDESRNGGGEVGVSPKDGAKELDGGRGEDGEQRERERSASVDQLADD